MSLQCQAVSFPCPRTFRLEASTTSQQKRCLLQEVERSTAFFLNLGFPSYADCKTFPQSLIQKLCKQRQVSCVVCTLAAYRTACAGCQPLQGGTTCFLRSSSFFIFALSPHTKAGLSTSPKEGPYRPPNNHGGAQLIYESPERADSVSKRLAGSLSNLPFLIHLMRVGRDIKGWPHSSKGKNGILTSASFWCGSSVSQL